MAVNWYRIELSELDVDEGGYWDGECDRKKSRVIYDEPTRANNEKARKRRCFCETLVESGVVGSMRDAAEIFEFEYKHRRI